MAPNSYYLEMLKQHGMKLKSEQISGRLAAGLPTRITAPGVRELRQIELAEERERSILPDGRRICSTCREAKDPSEYSKNRNKADGLDAYCKPCKKARAHQRYLARKQ
jgi:hypothetical protein